MMTFFRFKYCGSKSISTIAREYYGLIRYGSEPEQNILMRMRMRMRIDSSKQLVLINLEKIQLTFACYN
jgi:hypothetical protein